VLEPLNRDSRMGELLDLVQQGRLVARPPISRAQVALRPARAADRLAFDGQTLTTIHGPRYRMLVIGAGQLSKYLAQIAVGLDTR
jgi:xanthine dehydrogenase accessory factor